MKRKIQTVTPAPAQATAPAANKEGDSFKPGGSLLQSIMRASQAQDAQETSATEATSEAQDTGMELHAPSPAGSPTDPEPPVEHAHAPVTEQVMPAQEFVPEPSTPHSQGVSLGELDDIAPFEPPRVSAPAR